MGRHKGEKRTSDNPKENGVLGTVVRDSDPFYQGLDLTKWDVAKVCQIFVNYKTNSLQNIHF